MTALLKGEAVLWPAGADRSAEDDFVEQTIRHGVAPLVAVGQRAIAGETVLADLHSTEAPRLGERQ